MINSFFSEQNSTSFFEYFQPTLKHPPVANQYSLFEGYPFPDLLGRTSSASPVLSSPPLTPSYPSSPLTVGHRIAPLNPPSPKEAENPTAFMSLGDSPLASPVTPAAILLLPPTESATPSTSPSSSTPISPSTSEHNTPAPVLEETAPKLPDPKEKTKVTKAAAKTVLCAQYLTCGKKSCTFAHHPDDIVPGPVDRRYKSIACKREKKFNACHYAYNCDFFHHDDIIVRKGNTIIAKQGNLIYRKGYF